MKRWIFTLWFVSLMNYLLSASPLLNKENERDPYKKHLDIGINYKKSNFGNAFGLYTGYKFFPSKDFFYFGISNTLFYTNKNYNWPGLGNYRYSTTFDYLGPMLGFDIFKKPENKFYCGISVGYNFIMFNGKLRTSNAIFKESILNYYSGHSSSACINTYLAYKFKKTVEWYFGLSIFKQRHLYGFYYNLSAGCALKFSL